MRLPSLAKLIVPSLLLCSSIVPAAEPIYLEDARLVPLDTPPDFFGRWVDIDGNVAIVSATRGSAKVEQSAPGAVYVFERQSNGTWPQVAKLLPEVEDGESNFGTTTAVDGNTIVVGSHYSNETAVFERLNGAWTRTARLADTDGFHVDIHSGSILSSIIEGADLYRRGPSGWAKVQTLINGYPLPDADYPGPHMSISATAAIHGSYGVEDTAPGTPSGTAYIYPLGPNHTWQGAPVVALTRPNGGPGADGFANLTMISDSTALTAGVGNYVFERNAQGGWNFVQSIPGAYAVDGNTILAVDGDALLRVYRRSSSGVWEPKATLASSTGEFVDGFPSVRGNRVITGPFVYTLPASFDTNPPRVQEDLEDGAANGWVAQPNSTFSVVSAGGTRVYRQTNTASGASAIYQGANWNRGRQSIQADVTPRAYATPAGDRWFGLMVRYTDANNYYYITVRNSNTIQLRRMRNGVFTTLASVPLQVALNRTYPLRLEAHGQRLRVFVEGRQVISTLDSALTQGRPGFAMFRTQADFDNVILNADPSRIYKDEHFNTPTIQMDWDYANPSLQWVKLPDQQVFTQPSTAGGAHMVAGAPRGDQSTRARMRATQFSGADRWFGLIGRYVDAENYYYVTLRNSNNISLRKLTNNVITVLDTATMPVAVNRWYSLRLDIVGNTLHAYVDGRLVLEATDTTAPHTTGRAGLGSFRTAAEADDFLEIAP